jgi:hypothetical protein
MKKLRQWCILNSLACICYKTYFASKVLGYVNRNTFPIACSILAQLVTCQTTVNVIAKWIFIFTIVLSDTGLQMWTEDNWWTVTHIRSRLQGLSWPWRTRHHPSGQANFLTPEFSGQITMCLPPKQQAVREKQQPVIWWTHHLRPPMMTGSTPSLGWWLCRLSFLQICLTGGTPKICLIGDEWMSFVVKGNRWNQTSCTVPYAYTSVSQVQFEICTSSKYNLLNNLCLTTLAGSKRSLTICVPCFTVSTVHIFIFWNYSAVVFFIVKKWSMNMTWTNFNVTLDVQLV